MAVRKIEDYQDIIRLPHFVSRNRSHLSMQERAAQFSPFAALTGYDEAVRETARLNTQRIKESEELEAEDLDFFTEYTASPDIRNKFTKLRYKNT